MVLRVLLFVVPLALAIYALIDAIQTPQERCRAMPKIGWIVLVVLAPLLGAVAWLAYGKVRDTPGRLRPQAPGPIAPDDDILFLRELDRRTRKDDSTTGEDDKTSDDDGDESDPKSP